MSEVCQACGEPIRAKERVIAVRYGTMAGPSSITRIRKRREDYFHARCQDNVAIAHEDIP